MAKSNETSSSSVSRTEVDTSSGVTSETLYVQKFRGGELIYSSNKEYETIESVDCAFSQEIELPAVPQKKSKIGLDLDLVHHSLVLVLLNPRKRRKWQSLNIP